MKKLFFALLFLLAACNGNQNYQPAENALDAGREFIDACLKGDFSRAAFYMINNEENQKYLHKLEAEYRTKGRDGREQYREASITIREISDITETETIINYHNSFDQVAHKVKVIKQNDRWLVDLSYTFNPNL